MRLELGTLLLLQRALQAFAQLLPGPPTEVDTTKLCRETDLIDCLLEALEGFILTAHNNL